MAYSAWIRGLLLTVLCSVASCLPELRVGNGDGYINLGSPIIVHYNVSNGQDGRGPHGASDWIGLYRKGECAAMGKKAFVGGSEGPQGYGSETPSGQADDYNQHERHKCMLHWHYVPQHLRTGTVLFEYKWFQHAGEYEVRYFYGDDPTVHGAYHWVGEGYVCHTWKHATLKGPNDPDETVGATDRDRTSMYSHHGSLYSTSGEGNTVIDELATTGKVNSWLSPSGTEIMHDGMYQGVEGHARVSTLTLEQCQCDPFTIQSKISIKEATYGANCHDAPDLPTPNGRDITALLQNVCDGNATCSYLMDPNVNPIGDVSPACGKDLKVDYMCSGGYLPCDYIIANQPDPVKLSSCRHLIPDAKNKSMEISCPQEAARQECLAWRAGCGRCALDAVARAYITVVGRGEGEINTGNYYTAFQDTEGLPGFEFAVN